MRLEGRSVESVFEPNRWRVLNLEHGCSREKGPTSFEEPGECGKCVRLDFFLFTFLLTRQHLTGCSRLNFPLSTLDLYPNLKRHPASTPFGNHRPC